MDVMPLLIKAKRRFPVSEVYGRYCSSLSAQSSSPSVCRVSVCLVCRLCLSRPVVVVLVGAWWERPDTAGLGSLTATAGVWRYFKLVSSAFQPGCDGGSQRDNASQVVLLVLFNVCVW